MKAALDERMQVFQQQGNAMRCTHCRTELQPDKRVCSTCGHPTEPTDCPQCSTRAKAGQLFCAKCGWNVLSPIPALKSSPGGPPPSPADRHPLRTFAITLNELVGWPVEQVLATFGHPDTKWLGNTWPLIEPLDAQGFPKPYDTVLLPDGTVGERHIFGVVPKKILFPIPYETWAYHNVRQSTWLIHLTHKGATTATTTLPRESPQAPRHGLWQKLTEIFQAKSAGSPRRPVAPKRLQPRDPLVVAEVNSYPTGAIF